MSEEKKLDVERALHHIKAMALPGDEYDEDSFRMLSWKRVEELARLGAAVEAILIDLGDTPADCYHEHMKFTFPDGGKYRFGFRNEPGEHDPCYVVMPDGHLLALNHYNDATTDIARAKFIIQACNDRLSKCLCGAQLKVPSGAEDVGK